MAEKKKHRPKKWESMTPEQRVQHFAKKYDSHYAKARYRWQQAMDAYHEMCQENRLPQVECFGPLEEKKKCGRECNC